jgi:small-conductance mechanosensitive channel
VHALATFLAEKPGILIEKATPFAIFAIGLAACLAVREVVARIVKREAKSHLTFAHVLIDVTRLPSVFWCLAAALEISLRYANLNQKQEAIIAQLIAAFLIISISLAAASIAVRMLRVYGERNAMPFAVAGLSSTLTRVFVLAIGVLVLLHHFNIAIGGVLTALGIGGLAVALALQDTLANFFAGVHILIEAPIRLGDFIRLSSNEEGIVTDIGWRTTRVRTGTNNTIVIPNTKITSGILTNYSLPDRRCAAEITVHTGMDADPDQVAHLALDVAQKTDGVLADPTPVVLFDPGVTAISLQFKLIVNVADQLQKGGVQSLVRLGLLKAFREHKVPLPAAETVAVLPS